MQGSIAIRVSVCLSACLFVCPLACLKTAHPDFTKRSVRVTCGRGSALLWRKCNTLCKSSSVDSVIFHIMDEWAWIKYDASVSSSSPGGDTGGEVCRLWLHLVSICRPTPNWTLLTNWCGAARTFYATFSRVLQGTCEDTPPTLRQRYYTGWRKIGQLATARSQREHTFHKVAQQHVQDVMRPLIYDDIIIDQLLSLMVK